MSECVFFFFFLTALAHSLQLVSDGGERRSEYLIHAESDWLTARIPTGLPPPQTGCINLQPLIPGLWFLLAVVKETPSSEIEREVLEESSRGRFQGKVPEGGSRGRI